MRHSGSSSQPRRFLRLPKNEIRCFVVKEDINPQWSLIYEVHFLDFGITFSDFQKISLFLFGSFLQPYFTCSKFSFGIANRDAIWVLVDGLWFSRQSTCFVSGLDESKLSTRSCVFAWKWEKLHFGNCFQSKSIFEFLNPTQKRGLAFFAEMFPSDDTALSPKPLDMVSSVFSKMSLRQFFSPALQLEFRIMGFNIDFMWMSRVDFRAETDNPERKIWIIPRFFELRDFNPVVLRAYFKIPFK